MKTNKRIVMLGTRFDTMGGIASVVNVYRAAGLFERWPLTYIATHRDAGKFGKFAQAAKAVLQLLARLLTFRVGVLHVHMSSGPSFWRKFGLIMMARLFGVRYLCHLHGGRFPSFYEGSGAPARWLIRDVFQHAAYTVVLSEEWKQWVQSALSCRQVRVIANPVTIPPLSTRHEECTLLFLGRLCEGKGIYDLLRAMAAIAPEFPALRLLAGGDGEHEQVRAQAEELGIARHVEILGWITGADKDALIARATIYVLPSYVENLPMGVLEAMAAGLPVITTPVGGIPSTIEHGMDGLLVQPGDVAALADALRRLLRERSVREALGEAARRKAIARFSAEKVIAEIDDLYLELGMLQSAGGKLEVAR